MWAKNNDEAYEINIKKDIPIKPKKPKFIFHENVPNQNKTPILHQGKEITISEFISKQLGKDYFIENKNISLEILERFLTIWEKYVGIPIR